MKTIKLFVMSVLAILLAACNGGNKLTPASKKVNGPLGKFFEVVERDYKLNDNELSVEFKRITEGGPSGASWSDEVTFTVELQDEDGNSVASEHTNVIVNKEQLESVFSLGVDETTSITFKFDKDKAKKAIKFKISSQWKYDEEKNSTDDSNDSGYNSYLSERILTESDIADKSKSELEIMRNSIYARYGYIFKREDLFNHFSQYSWYKPTTTDMTTAYNSMSDVEKYNVDFIKRHE